MELTTKDLHELCQIAREAAAKAGELINKYAKRKVEVKSKRSGDSLASQVVTEVDLLCQNLIIDILSPMTGKFDLAILTEESTDDNSRLEKDYFWCIDPLDGTLSFVNSEPGYAVSIALISRKGISHLGVIYDPFRNKLYHAIRGEGAFLDDNRWDPLSNISSEVVTFSFYHDRSFAQHKSFRKVLFDLEDMCSDLNCENLDTDQYGGAALNAIHMLESDPACYFKFPKQSEGGGSLWDYAASACICLEAGAWVTDIFGNPLRLNQPGSTFMHERAVLYACNSRIAHKVIDLSKKYLR